MKLVSYMHTYAAAAKSLQSCPTLCDPIDSRTLGSSVPGFSRQEYRSGMPFPSPVYAYIPSSLGSPPSSPIPPLWVITDHWAELPVLYSRLAITACFTNGTWQCIYTDPHLPMCPTVPFPVCAHMSILYVSITIPALQIGSPVLFIQIPCCCC